MKVQRSGLWPVLWFFLLLSNGGASAFQKARPITQAETVLAMYTEDWRLHSSGVPRVIIVAWGDGHILWSEDLVKGGPPYRVGTIDATRVAKLMARLDKDGIFDIVELTHPQFGPDSEFTTILLTSGAKSVKMSSWHELHEDDKGGIVKKGSISLREELPRFQVLRNEPQDYLFYRFIWSEIRSRALALIPKTGEKVDGEVTMKSGDVSWQPESDVSK